MNANSDRPRLVEVVAEALRDLPDLAGGLMVAVSGGPDSVALLRAVVAVRQPGSGPIAMAHLNHQLRGEASDADEAFLEELHQKLVEQTPELIFCSHQIDVAAARAEGENLEAAARRIRYEWLGEVARENEIHFVATGHTADDQAETVLHRLLRGTGLQGLRGIAMRRELEPGVALVRPMLRASRADVMAYLESLGQAACHDASNDDLDLTRNRIRHELLPQLARQYNPGVVAVLGNLAEQADAFFREEEEAAKALLDRVEKPRAGAMVVLDRNGLAGASRQLVRSAFRHLWRREGWPVDTMNFDAWNRLAGVVFGEAPAIDLPGGIQSRVRGDVVQVMRC